MVDIIILSVSWSTISSHQIYDVSFSSTILSWTSSIGGLFSKAYKKKKKLIKWTPSYHLPSHDLIICLTIYHLMINNLTSHLTIYHPTIYHLIYHLISSSLLLEILLSHLYELLGRRDDHDPTKYPKICDVKWWLISHLPSHPSTTISSSTTISWHGWSHSSTYHLNHHLISTTISSHLPSTTIYHLINHHQLPSHYIYHHPPSQSTNSVSQMVRMRSFIKTVWQFMSCQIFFQILFCSWFLM